MQPQVPSVAHEFQHICPSASQASPPPPQLLIPAAPQAHRACSHLTAQQLLFPLPCVLFYIPGGFLPSSPSFCSDVIPSEKPASIPSNPYLFTQLYFSSEYLSLPHIMGSLSLFIYSLSVSLTGVRFTFTAVSPPPPAKNTHGTG